MKILSLVLILFSSISYAQEPAAPDASQVNQLVLVGRGFQNKDSKENIALACLDSECSQLQFVYFDGSPKFEYIGDIINAPKAVDVETQEKALALTVREFFYRHQTRSSAEKIDRSIIRKGVVIVGGAVALALVVPSGGSSLLPFAASGLWTGGAMYLFSSSNAMESVVSGRSRATLTDNDGWSWSSRPKKLNADLFRSLLARIKHGKPLRYFANEVYGSFDRDLKMEDQISRKQRRLEGVQWPSQHWER
jgi:hypothetical protein